MSDNDFDFLAGRLPRRGPYKVEVALTLLISKCYHGLTQPEAYDAYRDSCLHTTISALRHTYGIKIMSVPSKTTNGYGGKPFNRYWVAGGEDMAKAKEVLETMRKKRGVQLFQTNVTTKRGDDHEPTS